MPPWDNDDSDSPFGQLSQSSIEEFIEDNINNFTITVNSETERTRNINRLYRERRPPFSTRPVRILKGLSGEDWELISGSHMTTWPYEKLSELTDASTAAEALAGELNDHSGTAGINAELVEFAEHEIGALVEEGTPPDEAFNTVTNHWPRSLKALVAANESLLDRDDERYTDEVRHFARAAGALDSDENIVYRDDDLPVSELTYPVNPFNSNELNEREADAVIRVRLAGLDESELDFDAIEDFDAFYYWLNEVDSVRDAVDYHSFGEHGHVQLVRQFLPPNEWETMDPDDVIIEGCLRCSDEAAYGEATGGPTVATRTTMGGALVGNGGELFHADGEEHLLCAPCYDEITNHMGANAQVIVSPNGGEFAVADVYSQVARESDEGELSVDDLDDELREVLFSAAGASPPERDWYEVSPRPNVEPGRIFGYLLEGRTEIGTGPLMVSNIRGGRRVRAWFRADDPDAAQEAKDIMEGRAQEVSA